jgi:hypothetical protein
MPTLSKPLAVPQFGNYNDTYTQAVPPFTINLFGATASTPIDLFSIDLTVISQQLGFGYPNFIPSPNACLAVGTDLFVSISAIAGVGSNPPCAAILKFQGYFGGKNTTATAQASIFTSAGNAYGGLAFDGAGTLYAATTDPGSTASTIYAIYAFPLATGGAGMAIYNDVSANSQFGDLAFDASGNLWVADYNNNRVLAFLQSTLGTSNSFAIVANGEGPFPVVNTDPTLAQPTTNVFLSPEGIGFDGGGSLWVSNNNDGYDAAGIAANSDTSLVQITPALQATILASALPGGAMVVLQPPQAITLAQVQDATLPAGFAIYQVPTPNPPYRPQFGGLQIDTISAADLSATLPQYLYVNDEVYNTVRQYDINPASPNFIAGISAVDETALTLNDADGKPVVTNPGNGGIALVRANLLIADGPNDTGAEPDTSLPLDGSNQPIFWESPNIGVGTSATPPAPPFTAYESITIPVVGEDVFVYVNVQNIGCTPTTGTERLRVYWASGATTQSWPESWTEITTPPGAVVQMPAGQPLAPGASAIMTIRWPTDAIPTSSGNTHYCLLARIETAPVYPFGMTYWENVTPGDANMDENVTENSKIAQCNIYIGPAMKFRVPPLGIVHPIEIPIQAGNLGRKPSRVRLGFQLLDGAGLPVAFSEARMVIHADPSFYSRLTDQPRDLLHHLGDGAFHVLDPARGCGHLILEPREMLPLKVSFTPPPHLHEFALRALQYDEREGASRLVGGQTFVFGQVAVIG